ncbi:hypothetical protein KCU88_g130, partial [Aureobasidium melanogenum]
MSAEAFAPGRSTAFRPRMRCCVSRSTYFLSFQNVPHPIVPFVARDSQFAAEEIIVAAAVQLFWCHSLSRGGGGSAVC